MEAGRSIQEIYLSWEEEGRPIRVHAPPPPSPPPPPPVMSYPPPEYAAMNGSDVQRMPPIATFLEPLAGPSHQPGQFALRSANSNHLEGGIIIPPSGTFNARIPNGITFQTDFVTPLERRQPPRVVVPQAPRRPRTFRARPRNVRGTPARVRGRAVKKLSISEVHRFGSPGDKAIVLGSVVVGNATYNMVCLTSMDSFTGRVGPGGIRLFHAQFIKLLKNSNSITV